MPQIRQMPVLLPTRPRAGATVLRFGFARWLSSLAAITLLTAAASAQTLVYWDTNSTTAGTGTAGGTWNQNTTANWSNNSGGTAATATWQTRANTANSVAVFSAGTNATGAFTVTTSGTITNFGGANFEEGTVTVGGTGTLTLSQNATITTTGTGIISSTITDGASSFSLTKAGAGALTLSGANTFNGGVTVNAGTLNINGATSIGSGTLSIAGGTIDNTSGAAITLSNNNAQSWSGNFAFTGTNNLNLGTGGVTLTANRTVTVNGGTLTVGGVVTDGAGTYTLTKAGNGTLVLSGNNNYGNGTVITGGKVSISNFTGLGSATATSSLVLNGGNLEFTGAATSSSRLFTVGTSGGGIEASGTGALTLTNAGSPVMSGTGARTFTFGGTSTAQNSTEMVITDGTGGATTVVKSGSGTWVFDGNNAHTYSGDTIINAGTLLLSKKSGRDATGTGSIVIGDGINVATLRYRDTANQLANSSSITINYNGTYDLNGFSDAVGGFGDGTQVSSGYGQILLGAATLTTGANNASTTFSGLISGSGSLIKTGSGTLTLAGNNSFSGGVTLSAGAIGIGNNGALGTGTLSLNGGGLLASGGARSVGNAFTMNANSTISGSNDLTFTGTFSNAVTAGTLTLNNTGLTTFGAINLSNNGTNRTLTIGGTGNALVSGTIANGSTSTSSLTKTGSGTLTLAGTNTYTGRTIINGGTLVISSNANLGATPGATDADNVTLGGGSLFANGTMTLSTTRGVTLTTATTSNISAANGQTLTYGGIITGAGNLTLGTASTGAGTIDLGGANTFTGKLSVQAGTVTFDTIRNVGGGSSNLGAPTTVANGTIELGTGTSTATLGFTGTTAQATNRIINLNNSAALDASGTAGITFNGNITASGGAKTLTLQGTGTGTVAGAISDGSGATSLTKSGTGNWTVSGTNTYTGATTVSGGTLTASGNNSLGNTAGNVTVSGGTLALGGGTQITRSGTLSLAGSGASASTGALHSAASTGGTSQWLGNITLGGNATVSAADSLLILGEGNMFSNTLSLGSSTITFNTTNATGVTPTYLPLPSYTLDATNILVNSQISGTGGLNKTGAGTLTLMPVVGGNTFTGNTNITGGNLILDSAEDVLALNSANIFVGNASGAGAADTVVLQLGSIASGGPAANNTIRSTANMTIYSDGVFRVNQASNTLNQLTLQGGHVDGGTTLSGVLTLTGGLTTNASASTAVIEKGIIGMGATSNFTYNVATGTTASGVDLRVDSVIQDGVGYTGGGSGNAFNKTGTGTMVVTGSNTYSGITTVATGVLNVQNNNGLGQASAGVGTTANGTVVQNGAQLQLQSASALTIGNETLTLNGSGISSTGALRNISGANTFGGQVQIASSSLITANSGSSLNLTSGTYSRAGSSTSLTIGTTAQNGNITISGNMDNGASVATALSLVKNGTGTLTFTGTTGTVGQVSLNAGTIQVGSGGSTTLNTAAFGSSAGTTLSIATSGTVVANYDSGTTVFAGAMTGTGTFQKAGAGTLAFNQSFSAPNLNLVVSGGTLSLSGGGFAFGSIHITGNTVIDFNNSAGTFLTSGSLVIDAGVTVTVNNWVGGSTTWYVQSGAGSGTGGTINGQSLGAGNMVGGTPLGQVGFTNYNGLTTTWINGNQGSWLNREIRPTPEPSTYGAIFLSACLGLLGYRRYKQSRR